MYKTMISDTHNAMDSAGLLAMADPEDVFHHIYCEWNTEADKLTRRAREHSFCWSSFCSQPTA